MKEIFGAGADKWLENDLEPHVVDDDIQAMPLPTAGARLNSHPALALAFDALIERNRKLEEENEELKAAARLREDGERITRHEFKNFLNPILSLPKVMREDRVLPQEYQEYLEIIEIAGCNMMEMIDRSQRFSQMESGRYPLKAESFDLLALIDRILVENRSLSEKKQLSAAIRISGMEAREGECYTITAEKLLCRSMLTNLVKNALEASPEGEQLVIDIFREEGSDMIRISNRGAVPKEIRGRFFEKYATHGKEKGMGIGTYGAKLIAQTHGGEIHMDTADERQTAVTVRLPVKAVEERPEDFGSNSGDPIDFDEGMGHSDSDLCEPDLMQLIA